MSRVATAASAAVDHEPAGDTSSGGDRYDEVVDVGIADLECEAASQPRVRSGEHEVQSGHDARDVERAVGIGPAAWNQQTRIASTGNRRQSGGDRLAVRQNDAADSPRAHGARCEGDVQAVGARPRSQVDSCGGADVRRARVVDGDLSFFNHFAVRPRPTGNHRARRLLEGADA